ncbi:MAG: hypothetical protein KatS3mg083_081 [Candidatus Dojkabacteria bacterium]|nr:MAG: hypothetical protein KatS3mg083_081 [Candidatus Dojkabacteria bacterium]
MQRHTDLCLSVVVSLAPAKETAARVDRRCAPAQRAPARCAAKSPRLSGVCPAPGEISPGAE